MTKNAKIILGIVAIGTVGVAIGMLLAPKKGSDLRKSIKNKVDDLSDKISELKELGMDRWADCTDDLVSKVQNVKKDVKDGEQKIKNSLS